MGRRERPSGAQPIRRKHHGSTMRLLPILQDQQRRAAAGGMPALPADGGPREQAARMGLARGPRHPLVRRVRAEEGLTRPRAGPPGRGHRAGRGSPTRKGEDGAARDGGRQNADEDEPTGGRGVDGSSRQRGNAGGHRGRSAKAAPWVGPGGPSAGSDLVPGRSSGGKAGWQDYGGMGALVRNGEGQREAWTASGATAEEWRLPALQSGAGRRAGGGGQDRERQPDRR